MIDNFFSSQRPLYSLSKRVWNPPADIYETDEATHIKMEVAGLDEEQLSITAEGDLLVVRGRRRLDDIGRKVNYHLMEVHYGEFERVFAFTHGLAQRSIKASYEKGFLMIEVRREPTQSTSVSVRIVEEFKKE